MRKKKGKSLAYFNYQYVNSLAYAINSSKPCAGSVFLLIQRSTASSECFQTEVTCLQHQPESNKCEVSQHKQSRKKQLLQNALTTYHGFTNFSLRVHKKAAWQVFRNQMVQVANYFITDFPFCFCTHPSKHTRNCLKFNPLPEDHYQCQPLCADQARLD